MRLKTQDKGLFLQDHMKRAQESGNIYDYVLVIGEGPLDENMYHALDSVTTNVLPIVVDHSNEKGREACDVIVDKTCASFRLDGVPNVRKLLSYISDQRAKKNRKSMFK